MLWYVFYCTVDLGFSNYATNYYVLELNVLYVSHYLLPILFISSSLLLSNVTVRLLGKSFWRAITIIIPYEKALAVRSTAHALRCEIGLMCVSQTFSIEKASSNISLHCSGTNKPWCYTCDTKWRKPRFDDYPTECKCSQCNGRNSCSSTMHTVMYFLLNTAREGSLWDINYENVLINSPFT